MKDGLAETREELKKIINTSKPPKQKDVYDSVHLDCKFCKLIRTKNCDGDVFDPTICPKYEEDKQISDADKLVIMIEGVERQYYKDQHNTPFIWLNDDGIFKNYKIDSSPFKYYLSKIFFNTFGKGLNREKLKDAILTLQTFAINSPIIDIQNRVAINEDSIYIDLCNDKYQSIKITKGEGYTLQEKTVPMFKRYKHMKQLPIPRSYDGDDGNDYCISYLFTPPLIINPPIQNIGGGDKYRTIQPSISSIPSSKFIFLQKLKDYINLNSQDFFLALAHLVNTFFINRHQTLLSLSGEKGSGKSSVSKYFKMILDPSITLTIDMPKSREELLQALDHHFYPCFDNVSWLSHEFSDIFCRTLTGAGTFKRMLWTDDEEFIRALLRAVNINGINVCTTREDLIDRSILTFALSNLSNSRKTEQEMTADILLLLPYILHDLYSLVSEVMLLLDTISPPELFRMADFTKVGCCVAEAFGFGQQFFIDLYKEKLNEQIKEALYNHVLGNIILAFVEDKPKFTASSTELYKTIKDFAKDEMGVSTRVKEFPSAPNVMSRQLNDLKDSFDKIGVELIYNRTDVVRGWTIVNHNCNRLSSEKTELEKLEALKNWVKIESLKGYISIDSTKEKIGELQFTDSVDTILALLRDAGDLTGADEEFSA